MAWKTAIRVALIAGTALPAMGSSPALKPPHRSCRPWVDSFATGQLDMSRWAVASGPAPGYVPSQHIGYFEPGNVSVESSLLSISLTQVSGPVDTNPSGVISYGGMIYTNEACGYGTYTLVMRMSSEAFCATCAGSAVSGAVSAGFLYANNSETEIDFEFSATTPREIWTANWLNTNPGADPTSGMVTSSGVVPAALPSSGFHTYKFVWAPARISFYLDGALVSVHTSNIPSAPARFMLTHWGANSAWGGQAILGIMRYFYIKSASFAPAPKWR